MLFKRRLGSNDLVVNDARGIVTGHYINFVKGILDVLDNHEKFQGHYIITDNAPIYTSKDIECYITSRSYGCTYLPPSSLELNPIEQFWSVVESKLKREKLLEKETISSRIKEACNSVLFSNLRDFGIIPPQNLMIA
jgi:transposase